MERERRPSSSQHASVVPIPTVEVRLKRGSVGLGFNIVGGADAPHIPGHNGIFISKVRPDSPAAENGQLHVGDRIVSVNGIPISDMTHDEAVSVFKSLGDECNLVVESNAEGILLSQPSNLIVRSDPTSSRNLTASSRSSGKSSKANSPQTSRPHSRASSPEKENLPKASPSKSKSLKSPELAANGVSKIPKPSKNRDVAQKYERNHNQDHELPPSGSPTRNRVRSRTISNSQATVTYSGVMSRLNHVPDDEEDRISTVSMAPSVAHSVIDDVPRTPRKPISILDPASPSVLTEVLFVSIGAVAIVGASIAAYRYFRR